MLSGSSKSGTLAATAAANAATAGATSAAEKRVADMSLGALSYLGNLSSQGVSVTRADCQPGLSSQDIQAWEKEHGIHLPPALAAFYRSADGLDIRWQALIFKERQDVGHVCIPPLSQITPMHRPPRPAGKSPPASPQSHSGNTTDTSFETSYGHRHDPSATAIQQDQDLADNCAESSAHPQMSYQEEEEGTLARRFLPGEWSLRGLALRCCLASGEQSWVDQHMPRECLQRPCQKRIDGIVRHLLKDVTPQQLAATKLATTRKSHRHYLADDAMATTGHASLQWLVLDEINRLGHVIIDCCLVTSSWQTNSIRGSVWLVEMNGNMHRIATSFHHYYRLLMAHLGVQDWQLLLTSLQPPSQAMFYFKLFIPNRLRLDQEGNGSESNGAVADGQNEKRSSSRRHRRAERHCIDPAVFARTPAAAAAADKRKVRSRKRSSATTQLAPAASTAGRVPTPRASLATEPEFGTGRRTKLPPI
ncbi:uncharacterized protein LOC135819154 [Sycon ciliatum]|uniref:uncharacterized protein LOC135819154 n=1 Tax=Sycon ciliatum TaxID=27933 RepID=UPI0031F61A45